MLTHPFVLANGNTVAMCLLVTIQTRQCFLFHYYQGFNNKNYGTGAYTHARKTRQKRC